ncbi:efflux RND transporter periplasmic adaptor subunit [Curvibacter sp. HBC61]|uniref:Efflux RND transporter periplasmic adaptor subunit n=1 Tax=Curvibacter cyanobacteriorum TaxID=3026422 RepID=A0ABT5MXP6_9BURK|nr:efflux RND transporter periplasmic adaptor subunit [Curvibacter sp. HBC61]MDD0837577.1 efflux RND transporter periplasmic adaptor subunit [Curvibacter sp. HBC61]
MSIEAKRWLRPVLGLALLGAVLFGAQRLLFAPPPEPAYITAPVRRADIEDTVLANGTLKAFRQVSVGAQVSGQVRSLKVKLGDTVSKGQLVAEIDSLTQQNTLRNAEAALASAAAQMRSAEATLNQADLALKRQQQMRASEASSQADLEAAAATYKTSLASVEALRAQVEQAKVVVDTARVNLGYTRIASPIDGQVVAVVTEEGTTVNANQSTPTIIIVAKVDTMTVKASISEADVTSVKPGQSVYFTILGEPERRYEATLRTIEPATDSITSSTTSSASSSSSSSSTTSATAIYYNGLFDVPNPDNKLRISMTAMVSIVRGQAQGALTVPVGALSARQADGRYQVKVLDAEGRVVPRPIRVGINNNVMVQVLEGLNEGDRVVLGQALANADAPKAGPGGGMRPPPGL